MQVMQAMGYWGYVWNGDIQQFGSVKERAKAMGLQGEIGQNWLKRGFELHHSSTAHYNSSLCFFLLISRLRRNGKGAGGTLRSTVGFGGCFHLCSSWRHHPQIRL